MNRHLSSREIDEWLAGQHMPEREVHLRDCAECAREVERTTESLRLFGAAIRDWSGRTVPVEPLVPAAKRWAGIGQWRFGRLALAAATLLVAIAVPVYRQQEVNRQAAAVQDEALLRQVQSRISQTVPAPMEPLAKLMNTDWEPLTVVQPAGVGRIVRGEK